MFSSSKPLLDDNCTEYSGPLPFIIYGHVRKKGTMFHWFKRISLKQWLFFFIILSVISFVTFNELIPTKFHGWIRVSPKVNFHCHRVDSMLSIEGFINIKDYSKHSSNKNGQLRNDSRILVLIETQYTKLGKQILEVLDSVRFRYKTEFASKNIPLLTSFDKGKFSLIIFENLHKYFNHWNRDLLDNYCRRFNVGIIGFFQNTETNEHNRSALHSKPISTIHLKNYPIPIKIGYQLKDYQLSNNVNVLRILRPGGINLGNVPGINWSIFDISPNISPSFLPISQALSKSFIVDHHPGGYKYSSLSKANISLDFRNSSDNYKKNLLTTVLQDNGSYDGIRRILFGNGLDFWLHKALLLDSLSYISNGKMSLPLQRYVQIDIDDIFVGERGTRLRPLDVNSLIEFQNRLQLHIPGFQLNLGYSGKFFHRGDPEEDDGDDLLIQKANHFRWFCHMYSHSQSHITNNITHIENEMSLNQEFAKANKLPVDPDYSISPHHSGVYPVHDQLYDSWKKILNIRVTSTEEYPHLRPAYLRRGFIYKNIMVLPRQTCGLYTHTIFIDRYPGGRDRLEKSIFGGELFYSFVFNQFNIFMTHQSNYANDRLAIYTFESVIKFIQCWTNLQLLSATPYLLAKKYFQFYPEERFPIWINPCEDKRHYNIWSPTKSCLKLPKFVILGPQKTGSTALYTFLSMHPSLISNLPSNDTFEEVQFFNGNNYFKGIDWYMNFFSLQDTFKAATTVNPVLVNSSIHRNQLRDPPLYYENPPYFFEKSSTYFDSDHAPMRLHSLLPHAKLIIILINPINRAYSWYQHMRAHNLTVALKFSFYEVVSLDVKDKDIDETTKKKLHSLRNRCLNPGMYHQHLEKWLAFFPPNQILLVDGDELRNNPVIVMEKLQLFFKLKPHINYGEKLRFDEKKGFYCQIISKNSTKCLGKSKGRHYEEIDQQSESYLHNFYFHYNIALSKLLNKLRIPNPSWLEYQLSIN